VGRRAILALAIGLSLLALVQARHRAGQGRGALLKWRPAAEALERGEQIYQVGAEGYPTLPLTLLVLRPFHAAGDVAGPLLWALFQVGLAWWIVTRALALAAGRARDFPALGQLVVLLLSLRVLLSDVLHGNVDILVAATVATAAWEWNRARELRAGLWIGLGAVLKVTPALALVYFLWRRSARAAIGVLVSVALFAFALPGAALGWARNVELARGWWSQMIAPYLAGRPLELLQTEHTNQSLLGVAARHLTDSVAIAARPPVFPRAVSIHWAALDAAAFRAVHLALCAAVVVYLLWCLGPGRAARQAAGARAGARVLGEFALLALAMLFLSERSWKHHYVLLCFPLAFLAWRALRLPRRDARFRVAVLGLAASALLNGLSGSAVLGARASDLAEAWGAWFAGGLALFVACGEILRRDRRRPPELAREPAPLTRSEGPGA